MSRPADSQPPELPGLTFVRRLGRGGYAEVFLYEQGNTHMRVAVKVLFKEHLTEQTREQFAAEANAMAELAGHPNIVQVFQADVTSDGRPYLVMKYYPQRNMAVRAKAERLPVPEVLQIGVRISCAVETAHRAGILHRDIKPANILTSQYGEPGLTDFGIATKSTDKGAEESVGLSVPWSAPEVVFATSPGDQTADVYSLGATLWHLLGGHSPFEIPGGDNSGAALMRRIREQPVPRTGNADVPASLERLLAQAMAKRPQDRPRTPLQLARSLQAIEAEQRWALTPLVLLEEGGDGDDDESQESPPAADAGRDQEPATRRNQPRMVSTPQAIVAPTPARTRPEVDAPTSRRATIPRHAGLSTSPNGSPARVRSYRVREGMPSVPGELATVHRPTVAMPDAAGAESEEAPTGTYARSTVWKLVLASAFIVVAVVGTALALSAHGAKGGQAVPTTIASGPAPSLVVESPDSPIVTGTRPSVSQVLFTWTTPASVLGDEYYWKLPGGTPQLANGDMVTLPTTGSQPVCITVELVRNSGQADSGHADSGLTCA